MKAWSHILYILTEIVARNLSVVDTLFHNYTFHFLQPRNNSYECISIHNQNSLMGVAIMEDIVIRKDMAMYKY